MDLVEGHGAAISEIEDVHQFPAGRAQEGILIRASHLRDDHRRDNPDEHHNDHQFDEGKAAPRSVLITWRRKSTARQSSNQTGVHLSPLHLTRIFNPKGIEPSSPGLRGTSYP